jgi:hypothetical protein
MKMLATPFHVPLFSRAAKRSALTLRFASRLNERSARYGLYAMLASLLFVLALVSVLFKKQFNFVVSDGRGYYVYLPSLVIDGDLDFSNQMREHWGVDFKPELLAQRTPRGLVRNKYPAGMALTLTPSFLAAHAVALTGHALTGHPALAVDGYSVPYQLFNLLFILFLGDCSMMLIDRLLTGAFQLDPKMTTAAVVVFWLGSHYLYYYFREPFMVHVVAGFWVNATIVLTWELLLGLAQQRLSAWRLFLTSFAGSMAIVCRPTDLFLLPFSGYLLYRIVRAGLLGRLVRLLPVVVAGLLPLFVQLLVWRQLYGSFLCYSYEGEGFHWAHPAAWQTLFSSRHGLFFWSPLLLLSVAGVLWRLWRTGLKPEPLLVCFTTSFLVLWYCNSSWYCWWFGDAFGARAFLELSGLFVLGLAFAFEAIRRAGQRTQRVFVSLLALALVYHFALMGLYVFQIIPRGDYLF